MALTLPSQRTQYHFGAPEGHEQYFIEEVNRVRMFPADEAARYEKLANPANFNPADYNYSLLDLGFTAFGVNIKAMKSQISSLPVVPPLAPNEKLMQVSRQHAQWMFTNRVQSHRQRGEATDGAAIGNRIFGSGYDGAQVAENIYAYGFDLDYAHIGLEVDWGRNGAVNGMLNPAVHRINNHNAQYREVGTAAVFGKNGDVGPVVGAIDFGVEKNPLPLVTGVAYYDFDGNGRYSAHEGIAGLIVDSPSTTFFAQTADGGGYVLPFPAANASYSVKMADAVTSATFTTTVSDLKNAKLDQKLTYTRPTITINNTPAVNKTVVMSVNPIYGATDYEWVVGTAAAAGPISSAVSSSFTTNMFELGLQTISWNNNGFNLRLKKFDDDGAYVQFNNVYVPRANSTLNFRSFHSYGERHQFARVQVSVDDGKSWKDVWNQVSSTTADSDQNLKVSLAAYADLPVRIRLAYTRTGQAGAYDTPGYTTGWYVENITFTNVDTLSGTAVLGGVDGKYEWTPANTNPVVVMARPLNFKKKWPAAKVLSVTPSASSPNLTYAAWSANFESSGRLPSGTLSQQSTADYDGDGYDNLLEYAMGTNPLTLTSFAAVPSNINPDWPIRFTYQRQTSHTGVSLILQASNNMITWSNVSPNLNFIEVSDTVTTNGTIETHTVTARPINRSSISLLRLVAQ